MLTAAEISSRLSARMESVCERLYPAGKRVGREWCLGSVHGEAGESLKVVLTGEKAGVWKDFATGDGGDALDLWAAARGIGIADALREAREYLGVAAPAFAGPAPRAFKRPARPAAVKPRGRVLSYLHGRGLTDETLAAFKVAANAADDEIVFPYLRGGELVNVKYLKLDRPDGKKQIRQEKDAEPCLFGWQAVPDRARTIVLCEGEIDAMTWHQMGFPALSVNAGAGNLQWVETEWDRLAAFDTVYVAFDRDEAGEAGATGVVERLGRVRCRMVDTPYKDANECLKQGLDRAAFRDVIDAARSLDPRELRNASTYADEVLARMFPMPGERRGWDTPFEKLTAKGVRFDESELILVNGINGHGKTGFISQVALALMEQGAKCCMASMEIKPARLLENMTLQACGRADPSVPFVKHVQEYWDGRLWLFDVVGTAKGDYLVEVFRYARARYGITCFFVDSLAKCGMADDDYAGQKRLVEALCDFKNETNSTVFLVTHSRKLDTEHRLVDKMDIKGTGTIADLADTITTVWRNKSKEDKPTEKADEPDSRWYWQKNRNGDFEGTVQLWYDKGTRQFLERSEAKPRAFVRFVRPADAAQTGEVPL